MKAVSLSVTLVLALVVPALAAPGDARLLQGTLDWPQVLNPSQHPVIVVRGDDGGLYYANISSAERRGSLTAGARIAVLGVEGSHANEIVAMLVMTNGPAEHAPSAPTSSGIATAAAAPAPSSVPPPTPAPGVDVARTASRTPGSAAAVPAEPPPSGPVIAPPSGIVPGPPAAAVPGGIVLGPPSAAVPEAAASASPTAEATQPWTELQGVVQAMAPRTLVLKAEDGQVVIVDVSLLTAGFAESTPVGSIVKVYGVGAGQRFKASGFIDTGRRR